MRKSSAAGPSGAIVCRGFWLRAYVSFVLFSVVLRALWAPLVKLLAVYITDLGYL